MESRSATIQMPQRGQPTQAASEPRDWKIWSIGEFATLSGVTIRALRFYDRKGLLQPAKISEAGYRLYSTNELLRLQYILTLKTLGCSLETIGAVLGRTDDEHTQATYPWAELLARQRAMVESEMNRLQTVARAIAAAEEHLQREGEISYNSIHTILKVITMQPSKESQDWTMQFFTDEQKQSLAERAPSYMDDQEQGAKVAADWGGIIAEVNVAMASGSDPASPEVQALADRWMGLVGLFTQGNKEMLGSLNTMYSNVENPENPAPQDFQAFYGGMKPAMAFIQKAMTTRK